MIGDLEKTVLDCPDPRSLAGFYAQVLGMQVIEDLEDWVVIGREPGTRQLAFQRASTWIPPRWPDPNHPQQLHLDIRVTDIDQAERQVTALGARRVPAARETGFRVYVDPVGHPFCLVFGRRPPPATSSSPRWAAQEQTDLRFVWGPAGAAASAHPGVIVVIVDVLRFTSAVDAALAAGVTVYPYRSADPSAGGFAAGLGAILAEGGQGHGPSLSPASFTQLEPGAVVVLPSPNGSTCAVVAAEAGATVVAACLRNAAAVARWVRAHGRPVSVVAAGERWPDGSLRPAIEDLVGAGAVLSKLTGSRSPEALAAIAAFKAMEDDMPAQLANCASALELTDRGFKHDVDFALQLDVSPVVPVLRHGAFTIPVTDT